MNYHFPLLFRTNSHFSPRGRHISEDYLISVTLHSKSFEMEYNFSTQIKAGFVEPSENPVVWDQCAITNVRHDKIQDSAII